MAERRTWHSIHVHHHGAATDQVVADVIKPACQQVGSHGHRLWFARHWRRGPHLRLNIEATEDEFRARILPLVASIADPYLATLPVTEPDVDAFLPLHRRLAAEENDEGPLTPWVADNSWHVDRYDDRGGVHRTPEAAALMTDFMCEANDHALALTAEAVTGGGALAAAFDIMVMMANQLALGGIIVGHLSYRSHAERYLTYEPGGGEWRREWADRFRAHSDALIFRLQRLIDPAARKRHPGPAEFVELLARYQAVGRGLYERGLLPTLRAPAFADPDEAMTRAGKSPFHRALAANSFWRTEIWPSTEFAMFRLALNLMYLQFTRVGVARHHRYFLCYLAAEATEAAFGCGWAEVVRGMGPAGAGGPPSSPPASSTAAPSPA